MPLSPGAQSGRWQVRAELKSLFLYLCRAWAAGSGLPRGSKCSGVWRSPLLPPTERGAAHTRDPSSIAVSQDELAEMLPPSTRGPGWWTGEEAPTRPKPSGKSAICLRAGVIKESMPRLLWLSGSSGKRRFLCSPMESWPHPSCSLLSFALLLFFPLQAMGLNLSRSRLLPPQAVGWFFS